jgi:hypothetical protein
MMVLMALTSIAIEQTKATEKTMDSYIQLLDCLATNETEKIRIHALKMILILHSGASYLLETGARSRPCRIFFMSWMPKDNKPIKLNGVFHTKSTIMTFVVVSAAETDIPQLPNRNIFLTNTGQPRSPQPKTPIHCNNATAVGITNNTVKRQRSRSMIMRFFWVGDKVARDMYELKRHLGMKNLADYQSKHHVGSTTLLLGLTTCTRTILHKYYPLH